MVPFFDKEFELRYFEMGKLGFATPTTMLTLLEETAAEHCLSIGHGLYDLEKKNIGWVLLSGFMHIDRYPEYKEKINIRTWLSSYSSIKGFRENIITDFAGNIIGRARGLWLFFDIARRRPLRIFDEIIQKWSDLDTKSIEHDISSKIDPIESAEIVEEFDIKRFDTDMYKHVNNIRYLQWAFESVPEEISSEYFLHSIDGRFLSEAQFGDTIAAMTNHIGGDAAFHHTIKVNSSDKVCATAKTVWKKL